MIEENIRKRLPIGNQVTIDELITRMGTKFSSNLINMAISSMVKNQELRQIKASKALLR